MDAFSGRDARIADIAERQHGNVTVEQLRAAGLGRGAIAARVRAGRLIRRHHGVYAVGHVEPTSESRWSAAVLACGEGAVLSHRSAAALWGFMNTPGPPTDVSVGDRSGRRNRKGIRLHRPSTLHLDERRLHRAIATTTPQRTLGDLRRVLSRDLHAAIIKKAERMGLLDGEPWAARTRSELEERFRRLCRRHRLSQPGVAVPFGDYIADFYFPEARLVVEVDSWLFHSNRASFDGDRSRDIELGILDLHVARVTDRQLIDDAAATMRRLRRLYDARLAQVGPR